MKSWRLSLPLGFRGWSLHWRLVRGANPNARTWPWLSLFTKLFLAFVAYASLLLGLMVFAVHQQVRDEFEVFLKQQESGRLRYVVQILEQHYATQGGWESLQTQRFRWGILLQNSLRLALLSGESLPSDEGDLHEDREEEKREKDFHELRRQHPPRGMDWGRNLTLVDPRGRLLAGMIPPQPVVLVLPVVYQERTVGMLRWHGSLPPSGLRFLERNRQWLWIVGSFLVALGAGIAWLVSRLLLRPVHELQRGTNQLQQHQLDTRIEIRSSDELGQLAQAFNEMAASLQNYEQQRQQWLADTAHELRTPLSILQGEIEALQDGVRPVTPASLVSLHQEVSRLQRIVEDLRLINHLELGRLELLWREVELGTLVEEALKQAQLRLNAASVTIEHNPAAEDLFIRGDSDRLHQVLLNLLENTAKHAPGCHLSVTLQQKENWACVTVKDNGPGVAPEDLPHLFDRFYRTEQSRNRKTGGSGLGLAICRELMQAHQGTIQAHTVPGGGLAIELCWPLLSAE